MNPTFIAVIFTFLICMVFRNDIQFAVTGVRDEYPHEIREHHTSVRHIDSFNNAVVTHDPDCQLCKKLNKQAK